MGCVFVLFQVKSWLFSIPLRTVSNTKTQENLSVFIRGLTNINTDIRTVDWVTATARL